MTAPVVARGGFRFSSDGRRAACLATHDDGRRYAEAWQMTGTGPRLTFRAEAAGSPLMAQVIAVPDGRVLRTWHSPGRQTAELIAPGGDRRTLGWTSTPMRLLPGYARAGVLGLGVAGSALYELREDEPWRHLIARFPGPIGEVAVDATRAYVTTVADGRPTPVVVDPSRDSVRPLVEPVPPEPCHVLLHGGGQVLLTIETGGRHRLALTAAHGPLRRIDGPEGLAGPVTPVALDPAGRTLALLVGRGARSDLVLYDIESLSRTQVALAPSDLVPLAAWPAEGLWLPHSTPTRPLGFGWLTDLALRDCAEPGGEWRPGHPGRTERFAGPAGPIEAVVYGDWRDDRPVVVALHGGPERHWTVGFDRLFQALAEAGVTVIAPNQRGSTGYGTPHRAAITGQWGGPDLADILWLCAILRAGRPPDAPPPAVYGNSYGAFLALLAAAAEPDSWSACVAVAPFRSAAALYATAGRPIRHMIDRLGGHGGPDLDVLAPRISADVLIAHGALDEVIPVGEARALVDRLTAAGHPRVAYREVPDRGHDVIGGHAGPLVTEIAHFLARVSEPARRR
ncbi:alpha/beta fold hydrolase [Streptosporangiaceae bacterium NEAU-GS5]|nr:alpha/beta fold hydrolase [Streptosporangiaceae bacterium NEAU-GS5]